jgi:hypothetical protein
MGDEMPEGEGGRTWVLERVFGTGRILRNDTRVEHNLWDGPLNSIVVTQPDLQLNRALDKDSLGMLRADVHIRRPAKNDIDELKLRLPQRKKEQRTNPPSPT